MAGSNNVPMRLTNFKVYNDSNDLLGIATVDLPEISAMTDTISGAGIAGELDTPVLGHYQSMTTTVNWRTVEAQAAELASPQAHTLDIRGSQEIYDAASGTYRKVGVRAYLKVIPKNFTLGSFEPGATTDSSIEFEVSYMKLSIDGKEVVEIDKLNFIARFNGEDQLAEVRKNLGMA